MGVTQSTSQESVIEANGSAPPSERRWNPGNSLLPLWCDHSAMMRNHRAALIASGGGGRVSVIGKGHRDSGDNPRQNFRYIYG